MDFLKLGLVGLPDAEASLVNTLFRLHRMDASFIWALSETGPFDAVLVDSTVPEHHLRAVIGKRVRISRLLPMGVPPGAGGEMSRPIRSDHLVGWLNSIEVDILHGGGDGFASTAAYSGHASSLPASRSGFVPVSASRPGFALQRFKLKRWPSAAILAADVVRIRAATLLSRRLLTLSELSSLSGMQLQRSEEFVMELAQHRLLETADPLPAPAPVQRGSPPSVKSGESRAARPGLGRALISSIRRRFGMG